MALVAVSSWLFAGFSAVIPFIQVGLTQSSKLPRQLGAHLANLYFFKTTAETAKETILLLHSAR